MTTDRDPSAAEFGDPDGDRLREERHGILADQLAAYVDAELPADTAAQIDAHLLGCARCRREVAIQRAIRARLRALPPPAVPGTLVARVVSATEPPPRPRGPGLAARARRWSGPIVALSGWAVAAVLAALLLAGGRERGAVTSPAPAAAPTNDAGATIPMVEAAVADYRAVMAAELPAGPDALPVVRAAVPFTVEPLEADELRLIAAWTTQIRGEPAAALAYRWGDRVVVQYVVSERLFFKNPTVRQAVATSRVYATVRGAQSVMAWPDRESGTLLVADGTPESLARLRPTRDSAAAPTTMSAPQEEGWE